MTVPVAAPAPAPTPDAFASVATISQRVVAGAIDAAVLFVITAALFVAASRPVTLGDGIPGCAQLEADAAGRLCVSLGDSARVAEPGDVRSWLLATGIVALTLYAAFPAVAGASIGKLVAGLRVVDRRGHIAGPVAMFQRALAWVVDGFPWAFPVVGLVAMGRNEHRQRLGDRLADTYVVPRAETGRAVVPAPIWFVPQVAPASPGAPAVPAARSAWVPPLAPNPDPPAPAPAVTPPPPPPAPPA